MTKKKMNIIYMGTPDFAVAPLQALLNDGQNILAVVTVPDKPAGRGRKVHTSAVKDYAVAHGLNVLQPEKLREESFIKTLQDLKPDLMIVVAFRMLPAVVWKIPTLGTFNLHASLLPQYRGAAPINWAVINGEKESGVSTFLIDDKIDTGSILLQEKVVLEKDETAGSLHDTLMDVGAKLVVKTVNGLAEGTVTPKLQDENGVLKNAPKIFREDCRIDWNLPAKKIEAFIRGLSPYPAAFTTVKSDEINGDMKITGAQFVGEGEKSATPKMKIIGKELLVFLKDGALKLTHVQPQGKRAMPASDFINGIQNKSQDFELF